MATVRGGSQTQRGGYHNQQDIEKTQRDATPRDDISNAYAGEENRGPFSDETDSKHSTNVKARKTEKSKTRTPER